MMLTLKLFLLVFGVNHVNSAISKCERYNLGSKNIAKKISTMFNHIEAFSPQTLIDSYGIEMVIAIDNILSEMEVYDRSLSIFDNYLDDYVFKDKKKLKVYYFARCSLSHIAKNITDNYENLKTIGKRIWSLKSGGDFFKNLTDMKTENNNLLNRRMGDIFEANDTHNEAMPISDNSGTGFTPDSFHDSNRLAQYIMFEIYSTLISLQLKALAIDVFSFQNEYVKKAVSERKSSRNELKKNIMNSVSSVEKNLEDVCSLMKMRVFHSSRKIENGDARQLKRDENFIELERVFQLIVYPKADYRRQDPCRGTCSEMSGETHGENRCYDGYCASCEGEIRDCWDGAAISYCPSKKKSLRRYEWLEIHGNDDSDSEKLGSFRKRYGVMKDDGSHVRERLDDDDEYNCSSGIRRVEPKIIGFTVLGRPSMRDTCAFCVCTCEETTDYSKKSVFIISSRMANADTSEEMVVTGVRFVKQDRIIYTQIKQGRLMSGGRIDQQNNEWKPIDALNRTEVNDKLKRYGKNEAENSELYNDFIVISNRMKQINLDDLNCPSDNHVVTGIGLKVSETTKNPKRIILSIRCHRVNFENVNLRLSAIESFTINNEEPHPNQAEIYGIPPDRIRDEHLAQPNTGKYVEFRMSDKLLDASQSVIPWLDAQNVTSTPAVPLSGVGIHHRSAPNSGGFLAFRLSSIDYSKLL